MLISVSGYGQTINKPSNPLNRLIIALQRIRACQLGENLMPELLVFR
jgi:hypothetical protein